MKKSFSFILSIGISTTLLFAQTTNVEDSKYQFKKLVQLDATPVQSQGQTGTCWSFSATSFFESEIQRLGAKTPVVLSEMYVVRKAYELKAEKSILVRVALFMMSHLSLKNSALFLTRFTRV
jgi:bleomycin hydrolase